MIRTLLFTCLGPLMSLIGIGIGVYNYFSDGSPWRGEALWAVETAAASILLWGPLLAAAAAFDMANLRRRSRRDLMVSLDRGSRTPLLVWAAVVVPAGAVQILLAIPYALQVVWVEGAWQFVVQVVMQVLIIATLCALGVTIGLWTGLKSAPLVALVATVACLWGATSSRFSPFDLGASTGSLLGIEIPGTYLVWQAICLVVALAGLASLAVVRLSTVTRALPVAIVVLLLIGHLLVPEVGPQRYKVAPAETAPTDCVVGGRPQVCVFSQHGRFLDPLSQAVFPIYEAARHERVDDQLPSRFVEKAPGDTTFPEGTGGWTPLTDVYSDPGLIKTDAILAHVVRPYWCAGLYAETPPTDGFDKNLSSAESALRTIVKDPDPIQRAKAAEQLRKVMPKLKACVGAR